MSAPFARLDSRSFLWAGEWLVTVMGGELFAYVDRRWIGPHRTIQALEIAASK